MEAMADMGVCCWCRSTLLIAAIAGGVQAAAGKPSVAFFYGKQVPVAELSQFDWVVVQPENLDAPGLAKLQRAGVEVFAYLSAGEGSPGAVEPAWVLGSNTAWSSAIMNPAAAGWRNQVLDRADALWKDGYRALFLDTLDSYLAVLPGAEARRTAAAALASIVRAIHRRHPKIKLFFNRGFEILDDVGSLAAGLAAESLLHGWDAAAKRYVEVNETDRKWLLGQLQKVKQQFGIPVVVVDYLPPSRRATAREAARRIDAMGFSPWISTPSLDMLGVGTFFDAYDSLVISVALTIVFTSLHISFVNAGLLIGAAYVGQFVGAILFGYLGERLGRKPAFVLALALFGLLSFVTALTWDFQSLLIATQVPVVASHIWVAVQVPPQVGSMTVTVTESLA